MKAQRDSQLSLYSFLNAPLTEKWNFEDLASYSGGLPNLALNTDERN
jgi:hypothetical protein